MMPKTIQTMAWAYQQICAGEDPWTALGNFTNAWYDYAKDIRAALVSEPMGKPDRDTEHTHHWGAFCAASVEFLCDRYGVLCPQWVYEPYYILSTPWYGDNIVNLADLFERILVVGALARYVILASRLLLRAKQGQHGAPTSTGF